MYLRNDGFSGYDRSGLQIRQRGLFLLLITPEGASNMPVKALVRKVALRQMGHWMMGRANIGGHWFTVSGPYGGDGLTLYLPPDVYASHGIPLPHYLWEAWNTGGGWNDAGAEASQMIAWALSNLASLRSA
jgi:hypothetical protein